LLFSALAFAQPALAESNCQSPVTVVGGDTLFKIATRCGTTVFARLRANGTTISMEVDGLTRISVTEGSADNIRSHFLPEITRLYISYTENQTAFGFLLVRVYIL
jgi:hypothetical protein